MCVALTRGRESSWLVFANGDANYTAERVAGSSLPTATPITQLVFANGTPITQLVFANGDANYTAACGPDAGNAHFALQ